MKSKNMQWPMPNMVLSAAALYALQAKFEEEQRQRRDVERLNPGCYQHIPIYYDE